MRGASWRVWGEVLIKGRDTWTTEVVRNIWTWEGIWKLKIGLCRKDEKANRHGNREIRKLGEDKLWKTLGSIDQ